MRLPVLETQRLILRPAHPRLAKKTAAFYEKNRDFLQPFEPKYDPDFTTVAYQKALLRQDARAARDKGMVFALLTGGLQAWMRWAIFGAVMLLLVLLGLHGVGMLFRRRKDKGFVVQHTEYGDMNISIKAL